MFVGELNPPRQLFNQTPFPFPYDVLRYQPWSIVQLESRMTQSFTLDRFEGKRGAGKLSEPLPARRLTRQDP